MAIFLAWGELATFLSSMPGKVRKKFIDALLEQLKQFCQTETFKDDVTLMVFKCG